MGQVERNLDEADPLGSGPSVQVRHAPLYADDLEVLGCKREGGIGSVQSFVVMAAMGAPFKWAEQREGLVSEWA